MVIIGGKSEIDIKLKSREVVFMGILVLYPSQVDICCGSFIESVSRIPYT